VKRIRLDSKAGRPASTVPCEASSRQLAAGILSAMNAFYIAVGVILVWLFWAFTKACDKL